MRNKKSASARTRGRVRAILIAAVLIGLGFWILDSFLDFLFFYKDHSFLEVFFFKVPLNELHMRLSFLVFSLVCGLLFARIVQKKSEEEESFSESESKHQTIIESIRDPFFICTQEQVIEYASPKMKRMFGDHIVGQRCHEAVRDKTIPCSWCSSENQEARGLEPFESITKDGRDYQIVCSILKNKSKLVFLHDVTEIRKGARDLRESHKNLETANEEMSATNEELTTALVEVEEANAALQESEENYRSLFENMINAHAYHKMIFDESGDPVDYLFLKINRAFESMTGLKREEVLGRRVSEVLPEIVNDQFDWIGTYGEVARTGKNIQFEQYFAPLKRWYHISAYCPQKGYFAVIFKDITEERAAARRIRESEEKYRVLFETMAQGVVYQAVDGEIISANPAAEEILGMTLEEMLAKTSEDPRWQALREDGTPFPGSEHPSMMARATGKSVKNVVMGIFNPRDKAYRWINVSAVPEYREGSEKPFRVYSSFTDITHRKLAEEKIQESEERFRNLFKHISSGVAVYEVVEEGEDFVFLDFNASAERIEKIARGEVVGRRVAEVFPGVREFGLLAVFKEVWRTGVPRRYPIAFYHDKRVAGWRENFVYKLPSGEVVAVYDDVTEQKKAEEEIREGRRQLAALIGNLPGMSYRCLNDEGWTMLYLSPQCREITGYDPEEFLNNTRRSYSSIIHPEDRDDVAKTIKKALKNRSSFQMIYRIVTAGGETRWVWEQGIASESKEDAPEILEGFIQDISRRKEMERELQENYERLEATNEELNQTNEELAQALNELEEARSELEERVKARTAELQSANEELKEKSEELNKRIGELNCLYGLSRLVERPGITIPAIIKETHALLVSSCQALHKKTAVRVLFEGAVHLNEGFHETGQSLRLPIIIMGEERGSVEVFRADHDGTKPAFTEREEILLNALVSRLCQIIERMRAEEALRRSEAHLEEAQRVARLGNWVWDMRTNDLEWSAEVYRIFGLAKGSFDLNYRAFMNSVHPGDRSRVERAIQQAVDKRENYAVEHRVVRSDGETRIVQEQAELSFDEDGKPIRMFGTVQDVTEQRRAEEALRKNEAALREAQRIAHLGNWNWDLKHNTVVWSDEVYRIFGITRDEFGGTYESYFERTHPKDRQKITSIVEAVLSQKRPLEMEHRILRPDGEIREVFLKGELALNEAGEPIRMIGTVQDVTERKRSEEALLTAKDALIESAKRYTSLFEQVQDVIYIGAPDGTLYALNPAFERTTGWRCDEWIGRPFLDLVHPEDRAFARERFERTVEQGIPPSPYELRILTKSGDFRWVDVHPSPKYKDGELVSVFGIARDITDRKEAEQALIRSERLAAVGTLAGGVAHEFNNINTSVLGFSELALRDATLAPKITEYLERIRRAALRAKNITGSLLAFAGEKTGEIASGDLNDVAREMAAMVKEELETEGIIVKAHYGVIPPVAMDSAQMAQVVMNLLINARDALIDRPQKMITIETGFKKKEKKVWLKVQDTGCGIPKKEINKIFSPFYSTKGEHAAGDSPQKKVRGTGLGLSTSLTIVRQHDGDMRVESEEGQGTAFTIVLPSTSKQSHPLSKEESIVHDAPRFSKTVLILEDEEDVQDLLKEALEEAGCRVYATEDGEKALKRIQKEKIDLILLDIQMAKMRGGEFLRRMEAIKKEDRPPVIVLTGRVDHRDDQEITAMENVKGIMNKPFEISRLMAEIRKNLG